MKYAAGFFSALLAVPILLPLPASARVREHLAIGTVTAVQPKTKILTVHEGRKREVEIQVPVTAAIQQGKEMLFFSQIQRGLRVSVHYQEDGKQLVATDVEVLPGRTAHHRR